MLLHDAECPYWEQAQVDNILKLKVYVEKLINIAIPISPWKKLNIVMTMHCSTFCFPHILRPSKYMLIYQSQLLKRKKHLQGFSFDLLHEDSLSWIQQSSIMQEESWMGYICSFGMLCCNHCVVEICKLNEEWLV